MNKKIENWQIEAAKAKQPEWFGNLEDDCTSKWAGFLLRAECMKANEWWWAIFHLETEEEIDSANNYEEYTPATGIEARRIAESVVLDLLGIK